MVGPARFELATSALSERRNNQSMPRALRFSLPRGLDKNVMTAECQIILRVGFLSWGGYE